MWRRYYEIKKTTIAYNSMYSKATESYWIITYGSECGENADKPAYNVKYRTEELAIKGAERLYKRTHGWLEEAIGLDVV